MFSVASLFIALLLVITATCQTQTHKPQRDDDYTPYRHRCETLLERREWRTLSDGEKADYISAVKCLQSLPSQDASLPAAESRFDEFQAYHIQESDNGIHSTGQFLPWHRHYLRRYELSLRSECGYKGAHPYWAWEQDADTLSSFHNSPVFDPITGFGGDGVPGTYFLPPDTKDTNFTSNKIIPTAWKGCVGDGPFKDYTLHFGPGNLVTDHCLTRSIQDDDARYLTSVAIANATQLPTFELFRLELEGGVPFAVHKMHISGHDSVGGEMSNYYSSPGDPLFFLHHANLDRIWWMWQNMVPHRLYEISGRSTIFPPFHNVTLDTPLQMGDTLGPTVPLRDVMDIWSAPNCYTYV